LYERDKGLFPFSEKVLQTLKQKYKLGLVSLAKKGIEKRKQEIESTEITPLFDSIIIDTTKTSQHYLKCMKEMRTTPETTIIVDDRTVRGIKVGNQLGCETYWIQKGEYAHELPNAKTGKPNHQINSVEDLIKLL